MRRLIAALCAALLCIACSEPPQKEIDQAQGAIDAARAAGAAEYASTDFAAALVALKQSHDAVAHRDYRLALSFALEANERAKTSAKLAADGKALARSQAEGAVTATAASLQQLRAAIQNAQARRVPAKQIEAARATGTRVERDLQKARALVASEHYLQASETILRGTTQINEQIRALNDAASGKAPRRKD